MRLLEQLSALQLRRPTHSRGPIGLDFAGDGVFAIQVEVAGNGFALRAAAHSAYPRDRAELLADPAQLRRTLRTLLASDRFRGRRVATGLPSDQLRLMVVTYVLDGKRAEPETILDVVAERLREPLEERVIDYVPIRRAGDARGEASALVAIASQAGVIRHLELLDAAGLEVDSLEIAATAVQRLLGAGGPEALTRNRLVLYGERDRVHLWVLWGRRLLLHRDLDFGEDAALELLCKSLDLSLERARRLLLGTGTGASGPERMDGRPDVAGAIAEILRPRLEAIAQEIEMARVYVASRTRGESIDEAYMAGWLADWRDVGPALGVLCGLPIEPLDPFAVLGWDAPEIASRVRRAPFSVAAGLALQGLGHG